MTAVGITTCIVTPEPAVISETTATAVTPITHHLVLTSVKPKNGVSKLWNRFRRKKTGQVSSGSKGSKSYVIPTGSKIKSVDSHGYSNSAFDWNTMNKQTGDDLIQLSSEQKLHAKLILKSATEPCKHNDDEKKDRKHVTRTMTQPSGTITYTVKSSDTLTGIAARYDTTPSELVKLNRLASRFIFPDQSLFVPAKNLDSEEQSSDVDVGSCGDGGGDIQEQQNTSHKSPKPGHVERVQSPPLSPRTHILTEDEEKNLDRDCIERFLKINVRHITDGQGVVSGVLLVTPNAVMFDPNVSDQLVIEHGAEKYGVIAPMDYVVNAAMYNDIATMYVSHASSDSMQIHSPPQVYHARECRLSWPMNNLDTLASTRERRTDSIQAINGSMSDVGVTPEEDSSRENQPMKQMHHMSTSDSTSNLDSEVFVDEVARNPEVPTTTETNSQPEPDASNAKTEETETVESVSASECNQEIPEKDEVPESDEKATTVSDGGAKEEENELPSNSDPLQQQQSVTAAATTPSEQVLTESLRRKNSNIFENKMKALKQLSYPLTWMESIGGSEKDKENSPPLSALSETVPTDNSTTQPAQSTLSKIFSSASPKTLVDFSSGFFTKTADESGSQEEIACPQKKGNARPASLHETTVTGNSVFYDENGQRSWKSQVASNERRPHSMGESRERKVGFKSIVSVDDMPDLFASIDLLRNYSLYELIPRPAKACDDPPLYLCLRMGKPLNKPVHKSTPIMAYGKKRMKREYWFSIPRDRVDDLYSFFNHWAPNVYGDLDEEAIRKFGYELITNEEEFSDDEHKLRRDSDDTPHSVEEDTFNHRSDWEIMRAPHLKFFSRLRSQVRSCTVDTEVVSASDLKKQMSLEAEPELPELYGESELLTEEVRKTLVQHLPARAVGYGWTLIFSTESDGCSLKNLYRKMTNFETPVLLIIKDKENNVFGAMTSCTLKPSDHFYGTGESFLFSFHPEFEIFRWTGENEYFIKGNPESLAIGSGDGEFGLWLDGNLDRGRTHPCKTYANTMLSSQSDFFVKSLETWGFVQVDIGKPL